MWTWGMWNDPFWQILAVGGIVIFGLGAVIGVVKYVIARMRGDGD